MRQDEVPAGFKTHFYPLYYASMELVRDWFTRNTLDGRGFSDQFGLVSNILDNFRDVLLELLPGFMVRVPSPQDSFVLIDLVLLQKEAVFGGYTGFQPLFRELYSDVEALKLLPVQDDRCPPEITQVMQWWPLFIRANSAIYGFDKLNALDRPARMRRLIPITPAPKTKVRRYLLEYRKPCHYCHPSHIESTCATSIHHSGE